MHFDRLSPHYLEGFVKQCRDAGLNEDQAAYLLDKQVKYHLTVSNDHYREGLKSAMVKESSPVKQLLGLAGGGALAGGLALNMGAPDSVHSIAQKGIGPVSGDALSSLGGAGVGALMMLGSKGRRGNFRKAMPFSRANIQNARTGITRRGTITDLAKPFRNIKDTAITGAHIGAGATGGYLAPKVDSFLSDLTDWRRGMTQLQWLKETSGDRDIQAPWYTGSNASGGAQGAQSAIPNLSLLPQEVQQAAGATAGRTQGNGAGPNWVVDQAGQRLSQLDQQLAEKQMIANDPSQSPVARDQANQARRMLEAQRNKAISDLRTSHFQMLNDQTAMERQRIEERARAATRSQKLEQELSTLAQGPARGTKRLLGIPLRGNLPTEGEHAQQQRLVEELVLRNQQRQWELENNALPQTITPESQATLSNYGI
jgi:hypothetical protein